MSTQVRSNSVTKGQSRPDLLLRRMKKASSHSVWRLLASVSARECYRFFDYCCFCRSFVVLCLVSLRFAPSPKLNKIFILFSLSNARIRFPLLPCVRIFQGEFMQTIGAQNRFDLLRCSYTDNNTLEVWRMSYIACSEDCVYQKDGCCSLERVPSWQGAALSGGCLYRTASLGQNSGNRLADTSNRNQIQA